MLSLTEAGVSTVERTKPYVVIPMKSASRSDSNQPPVPGENGRLF
jgi:hypothetical protein